LEFEFFDEEGSGLGPTLEYYCLVTEEILKSDLNIWRRCDDGYLFPSVINPYLDNNIPKGKQIQNVFYNLKITQNFFILLVENRQPEKI
jgi:hypothetical protein